VHENEKLIERFYTGFKNSDSGAMIECYHPDVEFSDPVFPCLKGKSAKAMWAFLGQRRADPNDRTFGGICADAKQGSAHWEAKYVFPQTGRQVHNIIDAKFEFRDGKIIKHTDSFSFWKWSIMALGPVGVVLGWTPFLKTKIRKRLQNMLNEFVEAHPEFK
jgi:ketosteroid isomerase-like protein